MTRWQDVPNTMTPGVWHNSRELADKLDIRVGQVNGFLNNAVVKGWVRRKPNPQKPHLWLYTLADK